MAPALSADLRLRVEGLLRAGESDLGVQRLTGVSRDTAARYRKRLGLPGYRMSADSPSCRHGHPFPENVAHNSDGHLCCRECRRLLERARYRPVPRARVVRVSVRAYCYVPVVPDWAAIDRAVVGDPPERLTPRERQAAVARLDRQRLSAAVIADRVRCSRRTVYRVRRRIAA
jgi:hypothetical protein